MSSMNYPVRVDANLEPGLSRWLWLVKWLLVIPHYFVLFFLWVAFVLLSLCAFVAILVTGRYPRAIFDFNVGVLRWSWRVAFYAYGGLATDRYPPFALHDVPDYPAHLEVAYPERLSHGLVLVKWWLLAIPHYLVLAIFLGGGWYATSHQTGLWSAGLIGLLVLIAAVVLLFTGRYPQSIFDIVLGLNRWVLRVAAYVALMTDEYPPFRLDMGGRDPGGGVAVRPVPPDATSDVPVKGEQRQGSSAGWIVGVVLAVLLFLVGGALVAGGTALTVANQVGRDSQGYLMSPSVRLHSPGAALASENLQLTSGTRSALPERILGHGKLRVDAVGEPVFVGVARSSAVAKYLAGTSYSTVTDTGDGDSPPQYRQHAGGAPPVAPTRAGIWKDSAVGSGRQSVTWPLRSGSWTMVVMNPDGSPGVSARAAVGATVPAVVPIAVTMLITGGLLLVAAIVLLVVAVRRLAR